jgi:hypothetical protein
MFSLQEKNCRLRDKSKRREEFGFRKDIRQENSKLTPMRDARPEQARFRAPKKLGQLSDSNLPIPNFLAMVLDTNIAFRQHREAG